MQTLPGFREFYPEDCARRDYITSRWREVARRYGFVEYDGPTLESAELYEKKNSGGEILGQLYAFEDRGGRRVSLRPEMTPTLARMAAARQNQYRKPLKWFSIASFFRYERQQKGRLREFLQLNCDILGESDPAADAELLALNIDLLREFGLSDQDFAIRLSDRRAWQQFLAGQGVSADRTGDFLQVIDKMERETDEELSSKLETFGVSLEAVREFIKRGEAAVFQPLLENLAARGMRQYVQVDLTIVRGLAYYTGLVFEAFNCQRTLRALSGGGRYDELVASLSDQAVKLPAVGFGMGDVVLGALLDETPDAQALMRSAIEKSLALDAFVIVADESFRPQALSVVQTCRANGWQTEYALTPAKVGKQFQAAEQRGARYALVIGSEWPQIKVKTLSTREETVIMSENLAGWAKSSQA